MTDKRINLEDCIPIAAVLDDAIIARDGAITIGWEMFPCEEYNIAEEEYDTITQLLCSSFRTLGEWTMVHRQDVYLKKRYTSARSGKFLSDCYAAHFEGREYLQHRQFIWFTINPVRPGKAGVMKSSLGLSAKGIGTITPAIKNIGYEIEHFESRCSEFIASFTSSGCFTSKRLTTEDLEGIPGEKAGILEEYKNWFNESFENTDIIQEDGTYLDRENARMFSYSFSQSDDFPGEVSNIVKERNLSTEDCDIYLSSGSLIGNNLPYEHIVNVYFLLPEQQLALRELERRKKNMTAMSKGSAENIVHAEGINQFIELIHNDNSMALFSHMNIMVWGDKTDENTIRGYVRPALSQMGMTAKLNTIDMPQLFFAAFPGGSLEIGEDNLMLCELEQALCLGINETFMKGMRKGNLLICDRRRHIPVVIDTQEEAYRSNYIENYNAFILGPSGSGKSFFTNWYVRNCYDAGQHIFIIDKGDSYEGLCEVIREESEGKDGVYYCWSREKQFAFSPLHGCRNWKDEEDGELGISFIIALIKIVWTPEKGWNPTRENILYKIISDFIESLPEMGAEPVFNDFLTYVSDVIAPKIEKRQYKIARQIVKVSDFDASDMSKAMSAYEINGRFGFLLNSLQPADLFSSRFVVFEVDTISKMDKTFYALCVFCIIHAFEQKMRSKSDAFRLLFIEEAWQAISSDATADYLKSLWKTARKYHTSATVVTQQMSDIISSPVIKDAIISNSPVKILLDQKNNSASFEDTAELLGLTQIEQALVKSVGKGIGDDAKYKEVFISLGGKKSGVYALEVSPQECLAYESEKVKKQPLLEKSAELGSIIEAIKQMTEHKG